MNQDASLVFSNAPLSERVGPAVRLGVWATLTAESVVGAGQAVNGALRGAKSGNINNVLDEAFGVACSFSAETLVATADGLIPIGEISEGEYVLAYNETTGEVGSYPVTAVWLENHQTILYLTIDGEVIETTPNHPFYTTAGLWVVAGTLQPGDQVYQATGRTGWVEAVRFAEQPQGMYNLTVAEAHTFFVGDGSWLVHNGCDKVRVKDLDPLHAPETVGQRPDLEKLSDSELLDAVNNPRNGDPIRINTKTGKVTDGNARTYEFQHRMNDPNSSIFPDTEVRYEPYTPDDSFFWDLD